MAAFAISIPPEAAIVAETRGRRYSAAGRDRLAVVFADRCDRHRGPGRVELKKRPRRGGDVAWSTGDFVVAAALVLLAALLLGAAVRWVRPARARLASVAGVAVLVAAVWAELAVGVVGTPFSGS
ncbi:MAG: hypothetical protein ACKVVT_18620 [Dehalococcoidia bacterium]